MHYLFAQVPTPRTLLFLVLWMPLAAFAQPKDQVVVYPSNVRIEMGETASITAIAFDRSGQWAPNLTFKFKAGSGQPSIATIRNAPIGNTELGASRFSKNLAEITALQAGTMTFTATAGRHKSGSVTITIVDPAAPPNALISGDSTLGSPVNVRVGQVVELNGEASSGAHQIEWSWGDGDKTTGLLSAAHAYLYAGVYQVKLKITNAGGAVSENTVTINVTDHPAPTRVFVVRTVAELTAAYNQCTGGEHIVIPAGTVLTGQVELGPRPLTDFVTIRSSTPMSDMGFRTKRTGDGHAVIRAGHPNGIPFLIKDRVSKIRLSGLKFEPFATESYVQNYYMLQIGEPGQLSANDNPRDIIIDHCIINPPDNVQVVHGIGNDGYKVSVISSWLGNIKTYGGQDSQAVFVSDGRGAHVYNNTYFEAASESIIYGGAGNSIDGLVPSNIEFRRCVFTKRLRWMNDPKDPDGQSINIKNLFETKNARRVYVESSLFANHWDADRAQYFAILIKSTAGGPDSGQGRPWSVSEDIVMENNRVSHANGAFAIATEFEEAGVEYDPIKPRNIKFVNMLFDDITFGRWGRERGWAVMLGHVDDLTMSHTTIVDSVDSPGESREMLMYLGTISSYRISITDSILPLNFYGIRNTCGEGIRALDVAGSGWIDPATGASCSAPPTIQRNWVVTRNVFPRTRAEHTVANYPVGNAYPADLASVGMRAFRQCGPSPMVDQCGAASAAYGLREDSLFRSLIGTPDPGVDADLLSERLRCTSSGDSRMCVTVPGITPPQQAQNGKEGDLDPKTTGDGVVTAPDIAAIRNIVIGLLTASTITGEFQRADAAPRATKGDGVMTAADIVQIRRYGSSIDSTALAGGPTESTFELSRNATAMLAMISRTIRVRKARSTDGKSISVSVELNGVGDETAFASTLEYESTALRLKTVGPAETGSGIFTVNPFAGPGRIAVALDDASVLLPIGGRTVLFNAEFEVTSSSSNPTIELSSDVAVLSLSNANGDLLPFDLVVDQLGG
jgi:PKD repeat protein